MAENVEVFEVTIGSGTSISGSASLDGALLVGIQMPSAWTAANLTLQNSHDGTTFADWYDDSGNEYTITAAASRYIQLDPVEVSGALNVKVRSGTTGTPVNQAAARTLQLFARIAT